MRGVAAEGTTVMLQSIYPFYTPRAEVRMLIYLKIQLIQQYRLNLFNGPQPCHSLSSGVKGILGWVNAVSDLRVEKSKGLLGNVIWIFKNPCQLEISSKTEGREVKIYQAIRENV